MQMSKSVQNTRQFNAGWGRRCCLLACLFLAGFRISGQAQTSLNVANYGAVGNAVRFSVNTVSNSPMVTVNGTNVFSSADIGKVIEVFRAGPWMYISNNPACGIFTTNQDTICLITNVTNGTNLWSSIPQGWTTNAYCIVGRNNATNFQNCINAAESLVSAANQNVTINIPAGTYLCIGAKALNPGYVMKNISDTDAAMTITSGGITLSGQSTNTILMGCGAGMEHTLWNNNNPSDTWPYGTSGAFVPMRGTMFICSGPIANSQYPLVFKNLTFDGGLTNGLQSYNYFTLHQGDGSGWDTTHHAIADSDGDPTHPQMNQLKVFTNCVFQHWRGEMLICWTAQGGTNTFNDIENCIFYDGNATADNFYYGQHVKNCVFNQLSKVEEFYQQHSTLPNTFEYNLCTNISGNNYLFTIVGATTNETEPHVSINNNTWFGNSGENFIQFSPAANVSVVSNLFIGRSGGIIFTSAGVQPSDGSAIGTMTNFIIACNTFSNSANPLSMDGYSVVDMLISNNVGISIIAAAGYKKNIVLANNFGGTISGGPTVNETGIQQGQYMLNATNNNFQPITLDDGDYAVTNLISYGNGVVHKVTASGSVFYLDDSHPELIPGGALLNVSAATWTKANVTKFYLSAVLPGLPVTLTNGTSMTFY